MQAELLLTAIRAAVMAGEQILGVYYSDFAVDFKADDTPLTMADKRAHQTISRCLKAETDLPVLSEEGREEPYERRKQWARLWIVDPLDGTKEFVKRNDEFTVNIALVENHRPVLGVIFVPVSGTLYFAAGAVGARKLSGSRLMEKGADWTLPALLDRSQPLPLEYAAAEGEVTIVGSRSHATPELEAFVDQKRREYDQVRFVSAGSSLKFCLVAEGSAHLYPRFGPTMEWDTAAGQAIAECSGACVLRQDTGLPLDYNKKNLINPNFMVFRKKPEKKEVS
ncbi:MAG: 3'(2'),5'-bisphosphate nucleotidase CysQ [Thermodesulfobacteriota bacterium]